MKKYFKTFFLLVFIISSLLIIKQANAVSQMVAIGLPKKTLRVGEVWYIGNGWTLTANLIDAKANPRQVWFSLKDNQGNLKDDFIMSVGSSFVYRQTGQDYDSFQTQVDSIFAGATSDMVQLKNTYINSNILGQTLTPTTVNLCDFTSSTCKKTLTVGEKWDLTGGYSIHLNSADAHANPRQIWLTLTKDCVNVDEKVLSVGQYYDYNNNTIKIYLDSVFAGATSDMAQFKYPSVSVSNDTVLLPFKTESWSCDSWSSCVGGSQTRSCTDANSCGTVFDKQTTTQSCVCVENWSCDDWSQCSNSAKNRTCTDLNSCGTTVNKPGTTQACINACVENWACGDWTTCQNNLQTRSCVDVNYCWTTNNKPTTQQACTSACNESWSCGNWTTCQNNLQSRVCADANSCGTVSLKPATKQGCDAIIPSSLSTPTSSWVETEKKLLGKIDKTLIKRLKGYIILQVEDHGEAWYLDDKTEQKFYLKDGNTAYQALRKFGLGIKNADLLKIPVGIESRFMDIDSDADGLADKLEEGLSTNPENADTDNDGTPDGTEITNGTNPLGTGPLVIDKNLAKKLYGKIVIQVESHGEAWYINPRDGKRYYMKNGEAAYQIMRFLSIGITNANLRKIPVGDL